MDWASIIAGALGGGGVVGAVVKAYYDRADRKRAEKTETKKAVIDLLPELSKAENTYRLFLSDSIYLHDIEGGIRSEMISTIRLVAASEGLVEKLKTAPLHLMGGQAVSVLSYHASNFIILEQELSSMQSSQNYEYDDPSNIAVNAKTFMERRLADLILELHVLRKQLTVEYVGRTAWAKNNKPHLSELRSLRRQAYNVTSLNDRFKRLRRWGSISWVRIESRVRRWWRERKAGN